MEPMSWEDARAAAFNAGRAGMRGPIKRWLWSIDGYTLGEPIAARTDLPAFPTSSVDGWAVRGPGPWRVIGQVLAGHTAPDLTTDGTTMEIATGAMVPVGTQTIIRVEDATHDPRGQTVTGAPRAPREWRERGEEATQGEVLVPAGTAINPGVIGLAASCGYDTVAVIPRPVATLIVFGDELLVEGPPGAGRVRDALGPQIPGWLTRLGADMLTAAVDDPVADTEDAHLKAINAALATGVKLVCTTGGTMHGPVDHLHPVLRELGAEYLVNAVKVRPGFPMLLAQLPTGQFLAGLPGNPQSAVVALVSLVWPLLAGLTGRPMPTGRDVVLGAPIRGRRDDTHLALVRIDPDDGLAYPVSHVGSSMLRGLTQSVGFAMIRPGAAGLEGSRAPLIPLPLLAGEVP